ncbi:MAG TPA: tetratricopeptide repeat protein [Blastocatellia bacterium]|nr:tetratricopeptide repeat protein [Blastocatellia bacterium]
MRAVPILLISLLVLASAGTAQPAASATAKPAAVNVAEFDRVRQEGNDALYNMDYATARERYTQMTKLAPNHPAGYVYLANNLWLELLNQSRRLTTSTYTGGSFYEQDKDEDKVDPKRDREFSELIKQALAATQARLRANPKDAEALYYQASAYGLRAGYDTTVKRSFVRAMGDANDSIAIQKKVLKADPDYVDAYMSIGLYEYVIDSLPFGWRLLARVAGLKGSKQKGIEHLELVTQKGKYAADDARVLLIGIYTKEHKPERALEIISQLAAKYPRNYLFGIERATMLYQMKRADEGSGVYAELLKDPRIAAQATDLVNYQWGESLVASGDHAAALERFNAVARWPKSDEDLISMAHLHAGQALDALGKREAAVAEYQIVLKRGNVYDSHKQAMQYVKKPYAPQAQKR